MPYLFKIEIKESPLHGRGVFALEDIPQGSTYWIYECAEQQAVPIKGIEAAPNATHTR